jgi:hypothetical protein
MKGNSNNIPLTIEKSAGKTQIRFNIVQCVKPRSGYDYDYAEIEGELSRAKIINAIIASVYSPDAEIALINNNALAADDKEYAVYQELRVYAKKIATGVEESLDKEKQPWVEKPTVWAVPVDVKP